LRLSRLLEAVGHRFVGAGDPDITAVTHDSRQAGPGALFAAFRGLHHDGRAFAAAAVSAGAAAVLSEGEPLQGLGVPFVAVDDARRAAGILAARLAGDPADHLVMVGITGTSGKTTTATLVHRILLDRCGAAGVFGTLGYQGPGIGAQEAARTTPEATDLQSMLCALRDAGGAAAVMECSSHALALDRLAGCRFDAAVFTNLSRDHLDYHATFDEYFEAKARLFGMLKPSGTAVVNADDPWGKKLLERLPATACGVTLRGAPGARVLGNAAVTAGGTVLHVASRDGTTFSIESPLLGTPNAENLLAAASVGLALGVPPERIASALGSVERVAGRMERVDNPLGIVVLVDYAHKPGALDGALRTCRGLASRPRRVVVVFGCGGDRDRGKRPEMGRTAARLADEVVVTADNPRSEDPAAIAAEIVAGIASEGRSAAVVLDRRAAIRLAVRGARRGDVVLIAGKGHETYQEALGRKTPFDDRAVARAVLGELAGESAAAVATGP
jgi:UDP-N-acetylmuramoyl-L-alanyl-D-glutamate--2,6-diaminopimelate ligase